MWAWQWHTCLTWVCVSCLSHEVERVRRGPTGWGLCAFMCSCGKERLQGACLPWLLLWSFEKNNSYFSRNLFILMIKLFWRKLNQCPVDEDCFPNQTCCFCFDSGTRHNQWAQDIFGRPAPQTAVGKGDSTGAQMCRTWGSLWVRNPGGGFPPQERRADTETSMWQIKWAEAPGLPSPVLSSVPRASQTHSGVPSATPGFRTLQWSSKSTWGWSSKSSAQPHNVLHTFFLLLTHSSLLRAHLWAQFLCFPNSFSYVASPARCPPPGSQPESPVPLWPLRWPFFCPAVIC